MARIVVHDCSGHPFQVQLSRELARRGHDVLHLYSSGLQTPRGALEMRPDDPPTFEVRGVATKHPIQKYSYLKRYVQEQEYGRRLIEAVHDFRPDAVLSGNAQLDVQAALQRHCRKQGARFAFWVQDLLGYGAQRILKGRYLGLGNAVGRHYVRKERRIATRSDAVVAITPDFAPMMAEWGVETKRVHVIPNWAPLDDIRPRPKKNEWSRQHGLDTTFNFVYTGTLGLKHNPELLARLAEAQPRCNVVVTSEGLGAEYLEEQKQVRSLDNLRLLGFQDFSVYSDVLGSADVLVAILEPEAGIMSVPSKVLSYHCAGKPILLSAPLENLAAKTVQNAQSGTVIDATDEAGFLAAAAELHDDAKGRRAMAKAARCHAESTFDIQQVTDAFEAVLGVA